MHCGTGSAAVVTILPVAHVVRVWLECGLAVNYNVDHAKVCNHRDELHDRQCSQRLLAAVNIRWIEIHLLASDSGDEQVEHERDAAERRRYRLRDLVPHDTVPQTARGWLVGWCGDGGCGADDEQMSSSYAIDTAHVKTFDRRNSSCILELSLNNVHTAHHCICEHGGKLLTSL